ncbi:choice-of-anchor B family protein [soil metagenome]
MQSMRTLLAAVSLLLLAAPVSAQTLAGGAVEAARAGFGSSVAITAGEVIVGEPANTLRPGTVYTYRRGARGWAEATQLQATGGQPSDGFGSSLSVSGETLVIGTAARGNRTGAAFVFRRDGNGWVQAAELRPTDLTDGDAFGTAVAVAGDVALVSAPGDAEQAGAVYVFRRSAAGWQQEARLTASDAVARASFGAALALDGTRAFIGMPGTNENRGSVVVFDIAQGAWTQTSVITSNQLQPNDRLGSALAAREGAVLIGAPLTDRQSGAIYRFEQNAEGAWTAVGRLVGFDASPNFRFGTAFAWDGNQVWAGAPSANGGRGAAYHFWRDSGDDWTGAQKHMPALALSQGAQYGSAIAVMNDIAAIGVAGDDHGAGSVVIFELGPDGWQQQIVLKSPPEALASVTGGEVRCSADGTAAGFDCRDVELLSFLSIPDLGGDRGISVNDIWGWTDPENGREYALVGRIDGTSFVDVSDPTNPVYVGNLPKTAESPASSWRDIKVYRNHAYVVADGAGPHGIQVLDLTRLRQFNGTPLQLTTDAHYRRVNSVHNIVINEESGFAYAVGASSGGETCGGGLHMIDIREPKHPRFVGCFADTQTGRASTGYSHDAQCVMYRGPDERYNGREICLGSNETALSIADVTDKTNPRALSRASYPNVAYSHQGWLTEDHRFFYMNDELDEMGGVTDRTRTLVWDVTDLEDPQLINQHMGVEATIDHNLYVRGNLMYQSNYKSGLRILDVSDPANPTEVAFFDTLPIGDNDTGFAGSWSNYPYFESGIIIVSSIGEGLFVLKKRTPSAVF